MFKVIITTVGNPDYNQDPDRPLWGVPEGEALDAPTLEALVEKVREFQDDYDIKELSQIRHTLNVQLLQAQGVA